MHLYSSLLKDVLTIPKTFSVFCQRFGHKNTPSTDLDQKYRKKKASQSMCDIQSFPSLLRVVSPRHKQPLRCCEGHRRGFWFGTRPRPQTWHIFWEHGVRILSLSSSPARFIGLLHTHTHTEEEATVTAAQMHHDRVWLLPFLWMLAMVYWYINNVSNLHQHSCM